jgi:small nuclear ribonucleoprotein (snRNP)-like protein
MQSINMNEIKHNQVVTIEVKNGLKFTGHFRGVSTLINNHMNFTTKRYMNLAAIVADPNQPETSILNNVAINVSQIVVISVDEKMAEKVKRIMWQRAANQVADTFNKIDWSKVDLSTDTDKVEA